MNQESDRQTRVLVVTSVFPRWKSDSTPPFVYNLCRDLVESGCQVTVLAPHDPAASLHENIEGICIRRFRYILPVAMQCLCYGGGMIVRLRENPLRSLLLPFFAIAQFLAVRKLLQEDYDLIHAHSLLPQGLIAGFANRKELPLVISSHGADVFLLKSRWKSLLKLAVRKSTALIANSSATREQLINLGAIPETIHKIPATPNFIDPDEPTHSPILPRRLLFAGRVIPEKGIDALVEAMPGILEAFPELTLRIAGSGVLETQLKRRIKALGLENSVIFLGWLDAEALRQEMRQAYLLVTPSRMIEGQNLVVTEALSVGCPVATTPRGGVLDLVIDGKTGYIIPEPVPLSIRLTLLNLLAKPESEIQRISLSGFSHFKKSFSRIRISNRTIELYRQQVATYSSTLKDS